MNQPKPELPHFDEVRAKLRAYVEENHLGEHFSSFGDDEDLFETGVLDSAALLALLAFVEIQYDLSIPDEDLLPEHFSSITAATTYIVGKLN